MRQADDNRKRARQAEWVAAVVILLSTAALAQSQSKRQVLVSILDRKLALIEDGRVVKLYPVAVGKDATPSPTGKFRIVNRVVNPTYYHSGIVIAPGPGNPLGSRWIGLNQKGYGIHGTNAPRSIGKAASHGCIRMAKRDLEEFFTLLRVGDEVEIRGERDSEVAQVFGLANSGAATQAPVITVASGE